MTKPPLTAMQLRKYMREVTGDRLTSGYQDRWTPEERERFAKTIKELWKNPFYRGNQLKNRRSKK